RRTPGSSPGMLRERLDEEPGRHPGGESDGGGRRGTVEGYAEMLEQAGHAPECVFTIAIECDHRGPADAIALEPELKVERSVSGRVRLAGVILQEPDASFQTGPTRSAMARGRTHSSAAVSSV